jgi:hypothetical protein
MGFPEHTPDSVRGNIVLDGHRLTSLVTGRSFQFGRLETPSLAELRCQLAGANLDKGKLQVDEVVGDARQLHSDSANEGAVFQVASQFNLLEMTHYSVTPEQGIGGYQHDPTQGPACAIACGAGTIYRNYFVQLEGQVGQTREKQIDCLAEMGQALGNENGRLWRMKNGYALPTATGLDDTAAQLQGMREEQLDALRQKLRIGVQHDTQVTLHGSNHLVTQVYCSALPVAYGEHPPELWEPFARLVLEASYEATLAVAALKAVAAGNSCGNNTLYLTYLGGGAFGNHLTWITDAMRRACLRFLDCNLNIKLVSHGARNPAAQQLIESLSSE